MTAVFAGILTTLVMALITVIVSIMAVVALLGMFCVLAVVWTVIDYTWKLFTD